MSVLVGDLRETTLALRNGTILLIRELDWPRAMEAEAIEAAERKVQEETLRKALELDPSMKVDKDTQAWDLFFLQYYPKMAASTVENCPSREETRHLGAYFINKWYKAVRSVNEEWYEEEDKRIEAWMKLTEGQVQKKDGKNELESQPELPTS